MNFVSHCIINLLKNIIMKRIIAFTLVASIAACTKENSNPSGNQPNDLDNIVVTANPNCITASNTSFTQSRQVDAFTGINYKGLTGNVIVKKGTQAVSITAPENVINLIEAKTENGVLVIASKAGSCFNLGKNTITVVITNPSINSIIQSNSAATITVQDMFTTDAFTTELSNASGNINAFNIMANTVNAKIIGTGNVEVKANNKLNVSIFGTGIVKYKGSPVITKTIVGTGAVVNAN